MSEPRERLFPSGIVAEWLIIFLLSIGLLLPSYTIRPTMVLANESRGGHDSIAADSLSNVWYLAEGYTGGDFDEWILIQNPNPTGAQITAVFMLPNRPSVTRQYLLRPNSRFSIHVDEIVPHGSVSTKIESDQPVIAERAMYFNLRGKDGGHNSLGVTAPSTTWYLAEGYTGGDFDQWVLIQNPSSSSANIRATFMKRAGGVVQKTYVVSGSSRFTIHVDEILPDDEVSVKIESTNGVGVIVERSMYFNHRGKKGGHNSIGVTDPSTKWYLAEGYTGDGFDEWILIQNPNATQADVIVTYNIKEGDPVYSTCSIPAFSRYSIHVDEVPFLDSAEVSTQLESNQPIVAERAMYFEYENKIGGHCSLGATSLSNCWYLAEGYTGGGFDEWVLIQNPNSAAVDVMLTYFVRDGAPVYSTHTIPASSRYSIHVDELPYLGSAEVSVKIDADKPVAVERATYFVYQTTSLFDVAHALDTIWFLSTAIGPRKAGTDCENQAGNYIKSQFEEMGYEVSTQSFVLTNGAASRNVIVTKPGTSSDHLVIGAHYDSKANSPGANDNASGVGVLLELARALKGIEIKPTVEFVAFGAEEIIDSHLDHHHFGSRHYVHTLSDAQKNQIMGMISLDMVGVGPSAHIGCMELQPKVVVDNLIIAASNVNQPVSYFKTKPWSDHEAFERAGIPVAWIEWKDDPNYHSSYDTFDKISESNIEATGKTVLEYILNQD